MSRCVDATTEAWLLWDEPVGVPFPLGEEAAVHSQGDRSDLRVASLALEKILVLLIELPSERVEKVPEVPEAPNRTASDRTSDRKHPSAPVSTRSPSAPGRAYHTARVGWYRAEE